MTTNMQLLETCNFWLRKKNKCCKQFVMIGSKFCRFHIPTKEAKQKYNRQACEYCKCLITCKKMEKHLKQLCPVLKKKRMIESQVFYCKDIHYYGDSIMNESNSISNKMISNEFLNKIHSLMMRNAIEFTPILDGKIKSFPEIRDLYFIAHPNKENLKHWLQIESIVYHIKDYIPMNNGSNDCLLLELGASKAGLGCMLHNYCHQPLLMIDVCRVLRNKEENRLNSQQITRIQCPMQHFSLSKYLNMQSSHLKKNIIAFSKHLCGAATDFGLRCVIQDNNVNNCKMIAIAFCCRGKCSFETYCNTKYLREQLGNVCITNDEFEQEWNWIRQMSTWEIDCKSRNTAFKHGNRIQMGIFCRRLIDEGRIQYLKMHGFTDVKLYEYCQTSVTKENVLMVALYSPKIIVKINSNACLII